MTICLSDLWRPMANLHEHVVVSARAAERATDLLALALPQDLICGELAVGEILGEVRVLPQ